MLSQAFRRIAAKGAPRPAPPAGWPRTGCALLLAGLSGLLLGRSAAEPLLAAAGSLAALAALGAACLPPRRGRRSAVARPEASDSFHRLLRASLQPILIYDRRSLAFLHVNEAAERKYGYSREEFLAMRLTDLKLTEDLPEMRLRMRERDASPAGAHFVQARHRRSDGRVIDVEIASHETRIEGTPAILAIVNDVTQRNQATEALLAESERRERAEALLRDAVDSISEGFVIYDAEDRLVMCNERYRELYPWSAEVMQPQVRFEDILRVGLARGEYREAVGREEEWLTERLRLHREANRVVEQPLSDGRWVLVLDRRMRSGGIAGLRIDISEFKATQEKLHRAQKMEAIGQLTGGVAHDFNNLLGIIIGNLELLLERFAAGSQEEELGRAAQEAVLRGAALTRQLLAFARRQPLAARLVAPTLILEGAVGLLRRTLGETIAVTLAKSEGLWPITVDVAQLEAAMINLALNARDAMPRGGSLTITACNELLDAAATAGLADAQPGPYVVISVSDTGVGMAPEVLTRAIDPFFTTKGPQGSGLGLSMVHGFVHQSGGHLRIRSEPGQGTTVQLYLPRAGEPALAEPAAALETPTPGAGQTILVVEDNASLRKAAIRQLQSLGYRTLAAQDGREALERLGSGAAIDVLFTDIVMPGLDGRALAEAARRLRPGLRILLTSGYTGDSSESCEDLGPYLLSKPYRKSELAARIRAVLHSDEIWTP